MRKNKRRCFVCANKCTCHTIPVIQNTVFNFSNVTFLLQHAKFDGNEFFHLHGPLYASDAGPRDRLRGHFPFKIKFMVPLTHEMHALEVALKRLALCPGQVRVGVQPLWTRISVPHVHCLLFSLVNLN